jgi:microcystin-dependent protein
MSEPYLGQLATFGFQFAPRGWAFCNGQLLPISQNSALFALIGTYYGGDGISTFALPDLRGRIALHQGQGNGLSNYTIGEEIGSESVTLNVQEIPLHSHNGQGVSTLKTTNRPAGAYPSRGGEYSTANPDSAMGATTATGGNQPHSNLQPLLVVNWCIALQGIFPSRN